MTKGLRVALEIGSSKLKVCVAREGLNDTLNVIDYSELLYDGYFQGEFVDFEKLKVSLMQLFESVDYIDKKYNKKLYVGLPAEFIGVETVDVDLNFDGFRKIKDSDISDLYEEAASKISSDKVEIISTSAITYSLDEGGRILSNPVGKKARQLSAEVSVVIAEKAAILKFNSIFASLGFTAVEYVSETLCEAMLIIPEDEREHDCLLIDVGHLSTSVSFIKGNGLVSLTAFSLGGGYITGDLCEKFNITYKDADNLKKQMVVSVRGDRGDFYDLITESGIERVNIQEANNVALDRLQEIGRAINQCVNSFSREYVNFLPTYLTGCGISKLRGGKDYLSKCIGRNIIIGVPDLPGQDKPENSAIFGILNYALKSD